jgi:hypothetical protein
MGVGVAVQTLRHQNLSFLLSSLLSTVCGLLRLCLFYCTLELGPRTYFDSDDPVPFLLTSSFFLNLLFSFYLTCTTHIAASANGKFMTPMGGVFNDTNKNKSFLTFLSPLDPPLRHSPACPFWTNPYSI